MNHILEVNIGTITFGLIKSKIISGTARTRKTDLAIILSLSLHTFPVNSVDTVVKPELRLNVDDVVLSGVSDVLDPWILDGSVAGL